MRKKICFISFLVVMNGLSLVVASFPLKLHAKDLSEHILETMHENSERARHFPVLFEDVRVQDISPFTEFMQKYFSNEKLSGISKFDGYLVLILNRFFSYISFYDLPIQRPMRSQLVGNISRRFVDEVILTYEDISIEKLEVFFMSELVNSLPVRPGKPVTDEKIASETSLDRKQELRSIFIAINRDALPLLNDKYHEVETFTDLNRSFLKEITPIVLRLKAIYEKISLQKYNVFEAGNSTKNDIFDERDFHQAVDHLASFLQAMLSYYICGTDWEYQVLFPGRECESASELMRFLPLIADIRNEYLILTDYELIQMLGTTDFGKLVHAFYKSQEFKNTIVPGHMLCEDLLSK